MLRYTENLILSSITIYDSFAKIRSVYFVLIKSMIKNLTLKNTAKPFYQRFQRIIESNKLHIQIEAKQNKALTRKCIIIMQASLINFALDLSGDIPE